MHTDVSAAGDDTELPLSCFSLQWSHSLIQSSQVIMKLFNGIKFLWRDTMRKTELRGLISTVGFVLAVWRWRFHFSPLVIRKSDRCVCSNYSADQTVCAARGADRSADRNGKLGERDFITQACEVLNWTTPDHSNTRVHYYSNLNSTTQSVMKWPSDTITSPRLHQYSEKMANGTRRQDFWCGKYCF